MTETVMMTLSEIAARDGVTKQAVSKTLRGLIDRHDIPVERDSRGRIAKVSVAHFDHYRERFQNPAKTAAARPFDAATADDAEPQAGAPRPSVTSFEEARRRNEWLKYQRQKLVHEEEAGQLVRSDSLTRAIDVVGREAHAIISRLPNRADALSAAAAQDGIRGLRLALQDIAFEIGTEIADRFAAMADAAPDVERVDSDDDDDVTGDDGAA